MAKINEKEYILNWIYKAGIGLILALPLLAIPPYFFQPDWAKSIIFRSIITILFFILLFSDNNLLKNLMNRFKTEPVLWGMAGLFFSFLLASIFSIDPLFSFLGSPYRGGGFLTFAFLFLFSIIVSLKIKHEDWRSIFKLCIIIGLLVSCISLIQFYEIPNQLFSTARTPSATIGNPITLAIYLSILFFISLSLLLTEQKKKWKIFFAISLLFFVNSILATSSRAVFFGLAAGLILFLFLYPQKNKILKTIVGAVLVSVAIFIIYINISAPLPSSVKDNKLFDVVAPKLSYQRIIDDERFKAWQTFYLAAKDKIILGWGPENQSSAFDKFFDPKITHSPWWDRAHNIFLDVLIQAGILGLMTYIFLILSIFWSLYKIKKNVDQKEKIIVTGLQSAFFGYLLANLFSLDSMASYIMLFLIIGYSLNLSFDEKHSTASKWKKASISFIFLILILFLWQYNYYPLIENGKMNIAESLVENKKCDEAFVIMDDILNKRSFLDSYKAIQYVNLTIKCNNFYPEKNDEYLEKGFEAVKIGVIKRPSYTRFWISLGSYANSLADKEEDIDKKSELITQAKNYLDEAEKLSKNHQEILIEKIKTEIISNNYLKAKEYADKCIELNYDYGACHFYSGITYIYLRNSEEAQKEIAISKDKKYPADKKTGLDVQAKAFETALDYKSLVAIYKEYINIDYNVAQYHSSLAYVYSLIGEYENARKEAMIVLEISPESKNSVYQFLQTLPY